MDATPAAPSATLPQQSPTSLPAGTLTFLFTDVEGSTPLWERHEVLMRTVTARHDALLDAVISAHGGRRVAERGEGDSIFAVFPQPAAALAAALAIGQAVLAEPWPPETPIRVRMALHSGAAELRDANYYGPVINRCARIRGLGHGGQILLSSALVAQVQDRLPAGVSLRSLGAHTLKGMQQPEEVYQLLHPSLPVEFPPLLSPQAPKSNLPVALSSFIGRETEQGEVMALLGSARLVTLTGSGGAGKTRLALAVASELLEAYPAGVWLVELATLADPALVPGAIAQVLGLREEPGRSILATLTDHLASRHLLLVLDNCEHLVAACAELAAGLLQACPKLHILATSREQLSVSGERLYRVPSLPVPDLAHLPPPDQLSGYPAVALFVTRAQERRADFALTRQNARAVAQICARLDGIPLAIELAAARVGSMPVEGIAARLDDRFRLLTTGPRTVLPRQQTLRAALDWSYDLLSEPEHVLLQRLTVFAGGWTLAAAEAVCAGPGVAAWEVLDLLGGLVNKSLVQLEESPEQPEQVRYRLLETVRQYGQERLEASGEAAAVRERHLDWCAALAEQAAPALQGPEQEAWLAQLETEHDNLRAALSWSTRESSDGAPGMRLAGALWRFWEIHGHLSEGRGWLERALARGAGSSAVRAQALNGAGNLAAVQGDYEQARALLEESLALRRELEDKQGIAGSLNNLGIVAERQGDYAGAQALYEESLALLRELGNTAGMASALFNLGDLAYRQGDHGRAATLHEESLAIERELGNKAGIAWSLNSLGAVAAAQSDHERAAALLEESLAIERELGDQFGIAHSLSGLGYVAYKQGEYGRATALYEESLKLCQDTGERILVAECLEGLAMLAVAQGESPRAARLLGAAEALREALGAPLPPVDRMAFEQALAAVRLELGEEAFTATWAIGRAMQLEEAIALALTPAGAAQAAG